MTTPEIVEFEKPALELVDTSTPAEHGAGLGEHVAYMIGGCALVALAVILGLAPERWIFWFSGVAASIGAACLHRAWQVSEAWTIEDGVYDDADVTLMSAVEVDWPDCA